MNQPTVFTNYNFEQTLGIQFVNTAGWFIGSTKSPKKNSINISIDGLTDLIVLRRFDNISKSILVWNII